MTACKGDAEGKSSLGRTRCDVPAAAAAGESQILFGDLHVHSAFSLDARLADLPLTGGSGTTGPAEHCDFARFCSQLDFWSINDHPEEQVPQQWRDTLEAIRTCNDLTGGYSRQPSMVSYMGWEWTARGGTPGSEFGHKNVLLKDTCDDVVPARPIAAPADLTPFDETSVDILIDLVVGADPENQVMYEEGRVHLHAMAAVPPCPSGVDTRSLPQDCRETAQDPHELYEKLAQWGMPALVIPHGTGWGVHSSPNASWRAQLNRYQHDPTYERLVEIYSGHGNSEPYRRWQNVVEHADGSLSCPDPSPEFEPCCWRAGEIIRRRSADCVAEPEGALCAAAVANARQNFVDGGIDGAKTIERTQASDWLDCGQCRDCFQPALNHRPGFSVQAALASTDLSAPEAPLRYEWGFIGSTDSHRVGPGAGYRESRDMSDSTGPARTENEWLVNAIGGSFFREFERQHSFYYAGALVAVHARARDRNSIWQALSDRQVYATSGERILLWFDLVNAPGVERVGMGGRATLSAAPRFEVRAVGSFKQAPGCPDSVRAKAPAGFIDSACFGDCYNPTDERYVVTRVEVVKIRPQVTSDEDIGALVEDPFVVLPCSGSPEGCAVSFEDPTYAVEGRPALYYVRAIQEPTLQFNAATLRCEQDDTGQCLGVHVCPAGARSTGDDCLAPDEERAWASPIYLSP